MQTSTEKQEPQANCTRFALMQAALEAIVAGGEFECERLTTGVGACFRVGWTPDARYWSDRCCPSCIAHRALYG